MVKWSTILVEIDAALDYFRGEGVKPTLRTLFYYLYSKGVIPNTKSAYKSLSRLLVKARKVGRYSWDFLEDRTRVVLGELRDSRFDDGLVDDFKESLEGQLEAVDIDSMIDETFDYLKPRVYVHLWADQPTVAELWTEKEALASTLQSWTRNLDVPIRVNRGYSSWTFIYNNVMALEDILRRHDKVVIYYLGDLDPSGVDIERFLREALDYFGLDPDRVEFRRLAVTPEQVEEFKLPPRPEDAETLAKLEKDPRYRSYTHPYIVELDALVAYAPSDFREIVRRAIEEVWDREIFEKLRLRANEIEGKLDEMLEDVKRRARQKILDELQGGNE